MKMIRHLVILVAITTRIRGQGWFIPCDSNQGIQAGDPALPDLPDQFETRVEANIVQKNYSTEITEYYDYTNNRGAMIHRRHGMESRSIMQFHNLERHTIFSNNTCVVSNLTDHRYNIFNFTTGASGGHVKGVKDILMFGKQFGEKYMGGNETVRGIPVDHWQACMKYQGRQGSFTLDYYFSKPGYNMSYGNMSVPVRVRGISVEHWQACMKYQGRLGSFTLDYYFSKPGYNMSYGNMSVPVRALLNGTGESWHRNGSMHSYYHVYDFFSFKTGPIQDENVFKIPVGVYCNGSVNYKPMPKLPDQFTVSSEEISVSSDGVIIKLSEQFYFDSPSKLLRNDNSRPLTRDDYMKYGNRPLSLIYDFTSNLVYTIDKWHGNCTVLGVSDTIDRHGIDVHMMMRRAEGLFNFMNINYTYQGKKTWQDTPVESWAAYSSTDKHFQEVLFLDPTTVFEFDPEGPRRPPGTSGPRPAPPSGGGNIPVKATNRRPTLPQVLVGLYNRIQDETGIATSTVNFYGFEAGHLDLEAFDVTQCYQVGQQYTYMSVKIKGSYVRHVSGNQLAFYAALRSALARGAGVVSTRITSVRIGDDGTGEYLTVFFTLLDKIKVTGINVPGPSLSDAKKMLRLAIATGLNFDVQYPTIEENFQIVGDSLWEMQPTVTSSSSIDSQKYGPGSMAGLGIGMLVVGAILGLLVAYGIYKKIDTSIPYKVTD